MPTTSDSGSRKGERNLNAEAASKLSELLSKETPLYSATLRALQWQRDNYLVSQAYADHRQRERERRPDLLFLPTVNNVKFDPNTLGHLQMAHLGSWFIPSPTVKQALMPLVLDQARGNHLYQLCKGSMISLIDSQQATMDDLVKKSVLELLEQERLRKLVMNSTKGYIADSTTAT